MIEWLQRLMGWRRRELERRAQQAEQAAADAQRGQQLLLVELAQLRAQLTRPHRRTLSASTGSYQVRQPDRRAAVLAPPLSDKRRRLGDEDRREVDIVTPAVLASIVLASTRASERADHELKTGGGGDFSGGGGGSSWTPAPASSSSSDSSSSDSSSSDSSSSSSSDSSYTGNDP